MRFKSTEEIVQRAIEIAKELPTDPRLHSLGYERAVQEVEAAFLDAIRLLRSAGAAGGILRLRGMPGLYAPDPGWDRPGFLAALGEALESEFHAGADLQELILLTGYVRQAYVADMPHWFFQCRPIWGE